jgi:uncharacterized protein (UPF0264 family)
LSIAERKYASFLKTALLLYKNFKGTDKPHQCDTDVKLLISPKTSAEAKEAAAGGADILDVKNPGEGALGANYPWVINEIRKETPSNVAVSCTLGDAPNLPGSFSLAAYGAASLGVDYVKVGVYGAKTVDEAVFLLQQITKAAKSVNPKVKVAAAGYADAQQIGALNPLLIPEVAHKAGADIAMIDTYQKDGKNLFDHLTKKQLKAFTECAHSLGLEVALAGSLRKQDLKTVCLLGVDIVGFRGAACTGNDRNGGQITRQLVTNLVQTLRETEKAAKVA